MSSRSTYIMSMTEINGIQNLIGYSLDHRFRNSEEIVRMRKMKSFGGK